MRHLKVLLLTLSMLGMIACSSIKNEDENRQILAKAFDKVLYMDDIIDALPENYSKEDSAELVRNLIDKWIKKQLILNKAEYNLTEEQKNVQNKLEDYRTSLLIYKYEKKLFEEELDISISYQEIEEYYNTNGSNFILGYDLVKAILIKLPRSSPNAYYIRSLYRSDREWDVIESLCAQYEAIYNDFGRQWVKLGTIVKDIPYNVGDYERFLKYRRSIETRDTSYYYFFHVKEYYLRSTVAPIDYVEENIRAILLNKRKAQFIRKLEAEIYDDAKHRGFFTIY